jgi:hypothetical protein
MRKWTSTVGKFKLATNCVDSRRKLRDLAEHSAQDITTAGELQVARAKNQWRASFLLKEALCGEVTSGYAVLADPPWSYHDASVKESHRGVAENHYSTDDLCNFCLKYEDREKSVMAPHSWDWAITRGRMLSTVYRVSGARG